MNVLTGPCITKGIGFRGLQFGKTIIYIDDMRIEQILSVLEPQDHGDMG